MTIKLREYQIESIKAVKREWTGGHKRTLLSMPTGTGKTWIFVAIVKMVRDNGGRCLILVNTDELVGQTVSKLNRVGIMCGVVKAGKNEWDRDVVVASIQTISRVNRLTSLPPDYFMIVVTDEAHYSVAESYQRVLYYFANSWHLGVTATAFRGDKKSLASGGWQSVAYVYTLDEAIDGGYLVPYRTVTVKTETDLSDIKVTKKNELEKDYAIRELEKRINNPERNKRIVEAYVEHAMGRKVLAFCAGVDHAVDLANAFRRHHIDARYVVGSLPLKVRREVIRAHASSRFPVLTNCQVLTTGYDDPSITALIMARPTESKVLYIQQLGRGLRPFKVGDFVKKECLVLDVVDVTKKHSLNVRNEIDSLRDNIKIEEKKRRDKEDVDARSVIIRKAPHGNLSENSAENLIDDDIDYGADDVDLNDAREMAQSEETWAPPK
jgi:superfamily II DNA or RNA helicase